MINSFVEQAVKYLIYTQIIISIELYTKCKNLKLRTIEALILFIKINIKYCSENIQTLNFFQYQNLFCFGCNSNIMFDKFKVKTYFVLSETIIQATTLILQPSLNLY